MEIQNPMKNSQTAQEQIYHDIRKKLIGGKYPEFLPSLRQLSAHYESSIGTIRQALLKLEFEKYIRPGHGKGYFVLPRLQKQKQIIVIERTGKEHLYSDFLNGFQEYFAPSSNISISFEHPELLKDKRLESMHQRILQAPEDYEALFIDGHTARDTFTEAELSELMEKIKVFQYFRPNDICSKLKVPGVVTMLEEGAILGINHLLGLGCRNILVILRENPDFAEGCHKAIADFKGNADLVIDEGLDIASIRKMFLKKPFDAVFAYGDFLLLNVIRLIHETGLKIPEDVAALGYYNTPWTTEIANVPISSISIKEDEMIRKVCDMATGKSKSTFTISSPEIVVRESTLGFKK